MLQKKKFLEIDISKKLKLRLKNTIIGKTLTYASETWIQPTRDTKQMNIFGRKLYDTATQKFPKLESRAKTACNTVVRH